MGMDKKENKRVIEGLLVGLVLMLITLMGSGVLAFAFYKYVLANLNT